MARCKRRKKRVVKERWTPDEVKLLRKLYRNTSTAEVACELDRTPGSVQAKASALGLRKTKKYLKSLGRA